MGIPSIEQQAFKQAQAHQSELVVPAHGLGRLSQLACWFAARQGRALPDDLNVSVVLFAADHAVASEVLASDQGIDTAEQARLVAEGRSAVNMLAASAGADVSLVDVGIAEDLSDVSGLVNMRISSGCGNIASESAMSQEDYWEAVGIGEEMANMRVAAGANLLIAGDIGRGNGVAVTAVICHLAGLMPEDVLGYHGAATGASDQRVMIAVEEALVRAKDTPSHDVLRELGGYEIAAMAGFYRAAARHGVPVLLDGLVSAAAALAATAWDVRIAGWMLASHVCACPGHRAVLDELGLEPLASLHMDIGQGIGAVAVLPMLQASITLHREIPVREAVC